jgi:hypothetical protein
VNIAEKERREFTCTGNEDARTVKRDADTHLHQQQRSSGFWNSDTNTQEVNTTDDTEGIGQEQQFQEVCEKTTAERGLARATETEKETTAPT